ncbi:L-rhamnose isomerase [Sedimentisphaera cyanobacteriorum]|uniref:L-rhamnose isomerase n=1 Tax=Sedimentisphaera cyanobacteriorum TaxID=1940790 RepID=A0A1Q2HPZ9_9BACT|nr:L-rhamnose isomerase [Sedimentisphaera cyanobacteriorum]AQQ09401.1 L-rhamnose isomerase [Sedimentisphaera cyanobacteriorum]
MSINIEAEYKFAKEQYASLGVDTETAIQALKSISVSIHCWQGDDVGGFEHNGSQLSGGIQATGNYPGQAKNIEQLRSDIEFAMSLIPGKHRLNLHACYLDNLGGFVDRDQIEVKHFESWAHWGRERLQGIDFNPTFFAHDKFSDGLTLSHPDRAVRDFWIEHGRRCREIAAYFGKQFNTESANNFWIPDGFKDVPVDRAAPRERLTESLDEIFEKDYPKELTLDSVESKLFGIGAESYTVGSHEFYMGYALSRGKMICLDSGHFHPTEMISEKISAILLFYEKMLLHVSRPVRWDSDHVVTLNEELIEIAHELVRSRRLSDIHIGLDFFDASINRIAAWVIGARNLLKAMLFAFLEPTKMLQEKEREFDFTSRLAYREELKTMPFNAVWKYYCEQMCVPAGISWLDEVRQYEKDVLSKR